ncbi:BamA/TamA family outer membrane protein [Mucilaginibacter koreensis]
MKKFFVVLMLLASFTATQAQPRFIPKFVRKMLFEKDSTKHSSFFLLPVFSSAPETGVELGASALYSFYTDTLHQGTRVSNIFAYGTFTTKSQQRLSLSTNYWTPANRYHYTASIKYTNFPNNFYGIGSNTALADKDPISEKRLLVNLEAEKRFGNYIYAGFVAGGSDYRYHNKQAGGIFETNPLVEDRNGGSLLFIGPSLTFDNRNNNTYTTRGIHVNGYLNLMQGLFNNNAYRGGFLNIEYTQFFPLAKRWVLGTDIQSQNLVGGQSPFYLLPSLGNDEMMRGYYNGRFRDRNLIAGQAELRYRLSDRLGLDGFVGMGTVFRNSFNLDDLKPNYGGGIRYFFDVEKGLTLRLDYGIGEKRPGENRISGFYFSLGEAF